MSQDRPSRGLSVGRSLGRGARSLLRPDSPLRRALPEPVREGVLAVRRRLPTQAVGVVDRLSGRSDGAGVSKTLLARAAKRPDVPGEPCRVWIAPANFAGQGWRWGDALVRHSEGVGCRSMTVIGPLRFRTDYEVDPDVYRHIEWQRSQERHVIGSYTHVLIEAERPVFGTLYGRTCEREIGVLRKAGLGVGLISHGSDVRVPSQHAARHPHSPFTDPEDPTTQRLQQRADANVAILRGFDGPVFVSTPDLLDYVPEATWCPGVVDPDEWASDWPVLARRRPRVVHVPSNGRLKGSELVDPLMRELEREGLIEYVSARGLDYPQIRRLYQEADIVLEQFVLGLYGVAAVEAMAAGRVVVGYLGADLRGRIRELTGREVPIVEADPTTVVDVVRGLVAERERAASAAAAGPDYARAVHDGRRSAEALATLTGRPLRDEADAPAPSRRGVPAIGPIRPAPDAQAPVRLLVGPANFAAQGDAWAKAAQQHVPGVSARSMGIVRHEVYRFDCDYAMPPHPYNRDAHWGLRQERYVSELYTHVLIEASRPVTGLRPVARSAAEEATLRSAGVRLAHVAHGTEVRIPSVHVPTTPWSPYTDTSWDQIPVYEENARANVARLQAFDGPVFVSTPDLLDFLPDATWLPVVVPGERWAVLDEPLVRERPVVMHAPSSSRTKGSDLVDPIMRELHDSGLVEYRRVRDASPADMPAVYADADIVLDQFVMGSYGVAGCEAMAAGRVVVGHCTDAVRRRVVDATGLELPIAEATPDTLADVVRELVVDREAARRSARRGREFVAHVHDGRRSAEVLSGFLLS